MGPPSQATEAVFEFPSIYNFPPFFTLQPNAQHLASQMQSWSSMIQSYCRHHHFFSLSLVDATESPLFWNKSISRRLQARDARKVVDWMCTKEGGQRAEWIGKSKDQEEGASFFVYWRRPEEWAEVVEAWVDETGQKGTVLTVYELLESDATRSQGTYDVLCCLR
jgi:ESCRT-II complex subunit VPS25